MRTLVLALALAAPSFAQTAQTQAVRPNPAPNDPAPPADTIAGTMGGPITIVPAGDTSVQVAHNGLWIDVDPGTSRAQMPLREPDVILITGADGAHLDVTTVRRLRSQNTIVIGSPAVAEHVMYTTTLSPGEKKIVWGAVIEAVSPGYIVMVGGRRLYFAGSGRCTAEMKAHRNIDVVFLAKNVREAMSPAEAAECINAFKPGTVYGVRR